MSYDAERVAKAVLKLLQDNMASALATVAGRWTGDPIALGKVQSWQLGYSPTVLEREKSEFPIVVVIPGTSEPQDVTDQWVLPANLYEVIVDVFQADDDEAVTTKKLLRYCEAAVDIFEANQDIEGRQVVRPSVDPSDVNRQHAPGMDIQYFTQWARINVVIER